MNTMAVSYHAHLYTYNTKEHFALNNLENHCNLRRRALSPECGYRKHSVVMQSWRLNNNQGALSGNVPWVKKLILPVDQ